MVGCPGRCSSSRLRAAPLSMRRRRAATRRPGGFPSARASGADHIPSMLRWGCSGSSRGKAPARACTEEASFNCRWENPLMGWTSSSDPLANVGRSAGGLEFTRRGPALGLLIAPRRVCIITADTGLPAAAAARRRLSASSRRMAGNMKCRVRPLPHPLNQNQADASAPAVGRAHSCLKWDGGNISHAH